MAIEIRIPATIRLTEARITSNDGLSSLSIFFEDNSGLANCFSIKLIAEFGKIFKAKSAVFVPSLTKDLDIKLGLNLSSIFPWLAKSSPVLTTRWAFLENHNVSTIMIPAANKRWFGVGTLEANTCILNSFAATPEAIQAS